MPAEWHQIVLSAKAFGHLSQGLYRTSAGAVKELISNSYDADASVVRVHTDFPHFETFSCEDDGTGISYDEFVRLMNRGIGDSYKRLNDRKATEIYGRPLIGRLGLGILALAQICSQFDVVSHHKGTKRAYHATIRFPPYTRQEMDKYSKSSSGDGNVPGGEYQLENIEYDSSKHGVRIFTRYLREPFRKRMRDLSRYANVANSQAKVPYKSFEEYLSCVRNVKSPTQSLNLLSEYDQLIFGLAIAPPLPLVENLNVVTQLPSIRRRQASLRGYHFKVVVDNLVLSNPSMLPADRAGHDASSCKVQPANESKFNLVDGPISEECSIRQYSVRVTDSDERFNVYELAYDNAKVAGARLKFSGYLFQQTGRIYPRDVQGVLVRLGNVAIGRYDNGMLSYPYAEGPRYSMISSEVLVETGFEDALNIDRDSFNELHPHYIRTQAYIHGLLHDVIFPKTWGEEKKRNKRRREVEARLREKEFFVSLENNLGVEIRKIERRYSSASTSGSPVLIHKRSGEVEINYEHPLVQQMLGRKKYAPLVEKLVISFERANAIADRERRRDLFYRLLNDIVSAL